MVYLLVLGTLNGLNPIANYNKSESHEWYILMPNPQILLPNPNQFLYNILYNKRPLGV